MRACSPRRWVSRARVGSFLRCANFCLTCSGVRMRQTAVHVASGSHLHSHCSGFRRSARGADCGPGHDGVQPIPPRYVSPVAARRSIRVRRSCVPRKPGPSGGVTRGDPQRRASGPLSCGVQGLLLGPDLNDIRRSGGGLLPSSIGTGAFGWPLLEPCRVPAPRAGGVEAGVGVTPNAHAHVYLPRSMVLPRCMVPRSSNLPVDASAAGRPRRASHHRGRTR
jgi:hypothetical protein